MKIRLLMTVTLMLYLVSAFAWADKPIRVASKNFNESYILGEIVAQLLESEGFAVERKFGLGGTLICYQALKNDEIDIYVEYTGTLSQAVLDLPSDAERDAINTTLSEFDLTLLAPFGFNNTYAITVRQDVAVQHGLDSIGDLAKATDLEMVFSHEFLERDDGWPGLSVAYALNSNSNTRNIRGIEHGLAYQAIDSGAIDVTDAYSTDGELVRYQLKVLKDDRGYFPKYYAAPLVRNDLNPDITTLLAQLANSIDDAKMQALNASVVFGGVSFAEVAQSFLHEQGVAVVVQADHGIWPDLVRNTSRHLQLTGAALFLAVLVGLGLALTIYQRPRLSSGVIYVCGLLQTIPSIALLALMIPLFGIGILPAIIALFLYSLLPILRNAVTALTHVDPTLIRVSKALGLTSREQLRFVLIPLSTPAIFAGIRTAAVISIGTATLAAFIGAGGLGDPIVVGLSLDNVNLILQGAIPAALLAILTELGFSALERRVSRRR